MARPVNRFLLEIKQGFAFVDFDEDNEFLGGRVLMDTGYGYDLSMGEHAEVILKVVADGEPCIGAGQPSRDGINAPKQ